MAQQINAAIQEKVNNHLEKAKQDWADYQEAFLATGGTQAELAEREMDVIVDYEIKSQTGFSYFFPPDAGGFTTVDANTSFYIRADGVPVVAFAKYEIAAGAAGIPEFPITVE